MLHFCLRHAFLTNALLWLNPLKESSTLTITLSTLLGCDWIIQGVKKHRNTTRPFRTARECAYSNATSNKKQGYISEEGWNFKAPGLYAPPPFGKSPYNKSPFGSAHARWVFYIILPSCDLNTRGQSFKGSVVIGGFERGL